MKSLDAILFMCAGEWKLAFCRGPAKGCTAQRAKWSRVRNKPCVDCLIAENENETVADLVKRLEGGDA